MDSNNIIGVDKLEGPLHDSLKNHFIRYGYTHDLEKLDENIGDIQKPDDLVIKEK